MSARLQRRCLATQRSPSMNAPSLEVWRPSLYSVLFNYCPSLEVLILTPPSGMEYQFCEDIVNVAYRPATSYHHRLGQTSVGRPWLMLRIKVDNPDVSSRHYYSSWAFRAWQAAAGRAQRVSRSIASRSAIDQLRAKGPYHTVTSPANLIRIWPNQVMPH